MNQGSDDRSTVGRSSARAGGADHSPDITKSTQSQPISVAAAAEPDPITALMFALLQQQVHPTRMRFTIPWDHHMVARTREKPIVDLDRINHARASGRRRDGRRGCRFITALPGEARLEPDLEG